MADDGRSGEFWVVAAAVALITLAFTAYRWLNPEPREQRARPGAQEPRADPDR